MKDQVKKFGQYIKEQRDPMPRRKGMFRDIDEGKGIAVMYYIFSMGSSGIIITFGEKSIQLEDNDEYGDGSTWHEPFDAAAELGASPDMIWSTEDSKLLFRNEMPN